MIGDRATGVRFIQAFHGIAERLIKEKAAVMAARLNEHQARAVPDTWQSLWPGPGLSEAPREIAIQNFI